MAQYRGIEDGEDGFELKMKFLCVASAGGPFEDTAFCAGFMVGNVYAVFKEGMAPEDHVTLESLVEQLDLVAMKYDYVCKTIPDTAADGWVYVTYEKMEDDIK